MLLLFLFSFFSFLWLSLFCSVLGVVGLFSLFECDPFGLFSWPSSIQLLPVVVLAVLSSLQSSDPFTFSFFFLSPARACSLAYLLYRGRDCSILSLVSFSFSLIFREFA